MAGFKAIALSLAAAIALGAPASPAQTFAADDYAQLKERAALLSVTKGAVGWRVNTSDHSLDIKVDNLSSAKAEAAAHFACAQPFDHHLHYYWELRVYLVDGHLAAECPLWIGH